MNRRALLEIEGDTYGFDVGPPVNEIALPDGITELADIARSGTDRRLRTAVLWSSLRSSANRGRRSDGSTCILAGEGHDEAMVIIAVVLLIFIGLIVLTRVRGGSTRRGGGFLDGGTPGDGAQPGPHHHNHHHDGGSWGGHHGGFDGGGGGHH